MRTWDRLSASFVKGLKRPGKFYDGGGLMLASGPTKTKGIVTKAWLYRYQINLRERVMGLGSIRVVSLAEAREAANAARKLVAAGIDPIEARDAERSAVRAAALKRKTFGECVDLFIDSHGDAWREKHRKQWENSMKAYCKPIWTLNVATIDTPEVLSCIEGDWKRAPVSIDRVRSRIGEVLGFAQARGHRPQGALPTEWKGHLESVLPAPRKLKPVNHHASVPYADAPALYAKLIATIDAAPDVNDVIPEICLAYTMLTAARSCESRGGLRSEIDANKVWQVPPSRMKRKRKHNVPLSTQALALIKRLPDTGDLLFAMNGRGAPVVAQTLRNVLKRHGVKATVHGFRSTLTDWIRERTNIDRDTRKLCLAQSIGDKTDEAYARSDLVEKRRRLMEAWAKHLTAAPVACDSARVVALRGRRHG